MTPSRRVTAPTQEDVGQRALDASVHSTVFGHRVFTHEEMIAEARRVWRHQPRCSAFSMGFTHAGLERFEQIMPKYSSDMAAAWTVVERMSVLGWHVRVTSPFIPGESYWAGFTQQGITGWNGRPDFAESDPSSPAAPICRAALAALADVPELLDEERADD